MPQDPFEYGTYCCVYIRFYSLNERNWHYVWSCVSARYSDSFFDQSNLGLNWCLHMFTLIWTLAVPLGSLSLFQNLGTHSRQEAGGITGSLCFALPGTTILYCLISSVLRAIVLYILSRCFCCFRLEGNSIPCYSFFLESEICLPIFALDLSFISKSLTYSSQW